VAGREISVTQLGIDWQKDTGLPVARSATPLARHTSATGAQVAAEMAGRLGLQYFQLLDRVGEVTDHQAARILGVGLSSINSTRNRAERWVIYSGRVERVTWPSGKTSERCYWRKRTPAEIEAYDAQAAQQAALPMET
jgi:hypothetical protein